MQKSRTSLLTAVKTSQSFQGMQGIAGHKSVLCIMQCVFSSSTIQLSNLTKGIWFKWLDESEAGHLASLKMFIVKHWQHNFEGGRGKGSEHIPFQIQSYSIQIPKRTWTIYRGQLCANHCKLEQAQRQNYSLCMLRCRSYEEIFHSYK